MGAGIDKKLKCLLIICHLRNKRSWMLTVPKRGGDSKEWDGWPLGLRRCGIYYGAESRQENQPAHAIHSEGVKNETARRRREKTGGPLDCSEWPTVLVSTRTGLPRNGGVRHISNGGVTKID